MAKVTLSLWRDNRYRQKESPIYLIIRHKNRRATVATGFKVNPRHWNARLSEIRKTHSDWYTINARLRELITQAESFFSEATAKGEEITAKEVKERLEQELNPEPEIEGPCFIAYCEELLTTWEGRWAYQTFLSYRTAVTKLRNWHKKRLPFKDITPQLLRRFQNYIGRKLENGANTQKKTISILKGFYAQALEDDIIPWGRNPFDSLSIKEEATIKEKLKTAELKKLKDLALDEDSLLADIRRWFLFAFYAGGMRFSDVAEMKCEHLRIDDETIRSVYRMGKTKSIHGVLLLPEAVEILEYYGWRQKKRGERLFPILDGYDLSTPQNRRAAISTRNALANKYLKKLQKRAEISTPISFHLSRHSVAGYLLEQGFGVHTIQQVLGHANLRVTERYLKGFTSGGPDEATRALRL